MTMTPLRTPSDGPKSFVLSPRLSDYLQAYGTRQDPLLESVVRLTKERTGKDAFMQVAPEQGALLTLLCRIAGATRAIEIGTFTGYSTICIARGLAPGGKLLTLDRNREFTDLARNFFEKADLSDKIEIRLGDALEVLEALPLSEQFDFAFLDADKPNYSRHYQALLPRLKVGGLLVVDNVLWGGKVVDPEASDDWTRAIDAFNRKVRADRAVEHVMLPVGDGMTIVRKSEPC